MSTFHPAKDGGAQHVKTSDRLCRQEIAYSQLTNTLAHTHAQIYLETCTLTKTLAHKLTYTQMNTVNTDRTHAVKTATRTRTHTYMWAGLYLSTGNNVFLFENKEN